ncbi:MAG: hypothetical protein Q9175_001392 [Cornicularia normoerica]
MISIRRSRTIVLLVLLISLILLVYRGHFRWLHHAFTAAPSGTSADGIPPSPFQPGLIEFWDPTSRALVEAKPDCSLPTEPIEAPLNEFASLEKGFDIRPDLLKVSQQDVGKIRDAHARFVAQIPELAQKLPYATGTQGIVVAASGALLPVFLVSLKMLRRTGSMLPVELFMESKSNYEKEICEIVLPPMNATCMILSEILEAVPQRLKMSGYQLKALALAFSSFDDVLLLDADNLPVEQPENLLDSEPFLSKGFVSWPDHWANTASPKFYEISLQPIPPTSERAASEAGQLLLSKSKHASTLLLTLYYNYHGPSHYYKLLSQSPAGQGGRETDKETYLAAAMSLNASFHTVTTAVEILGYTQVHDSQFKEAGKVQHSPEDDYGKNVLHNPEIKKARPSFLHANTHKLDASEMHEIFNNVIRSQRMWGGTTEMVARFGRDLEKQVWAETLYTGCHLEHAFSAWENKTNVCKKIGRVYKFLYN